MLTFGWLITRGEPFPRALGYLACLAGVLLVLCYLIRLFVLDAAGPVVLGPALLGGLLVPVVSVLLRLSLYRVAAAPAGTRWLRVAILVGAAVLGRGHPPTARPLLASRGALPALLASTPVDEGTFRDWLERHSPYAQPLTSLAEIARDWEEQRDGSDEVFTMAADVSAVNAAHPIGALGIAHVTVRYGGTGQEYRDLWLVHFDQAGRALVFEEWPFWPGQGWRLGA